MTHDDYKTWNQFASAAITGVLSGRMLDDMNATATKAGSTPEDFRRCLAMLASGVADALLAESLERKASVTE